MPERTSSNASTFSADRRDRVSVTVRPTDEKSRSDWAELADTHKKRLAVKDIIGSWSAFCLRNSRGPTAGADILLYSANSTALVACKAPVDGAVWSRTSANGSSFAFLRSGLLAVSLVDADVLDVDVLACLL